MNHYLVFVYGVCFSLIGGAAFAMMWSNIMSIDMKPKPIGKKHPEAPEEGEEVNMPGRSLHGGRGRGAASAGSGRRYRTRVA